VAAVLVVAACAAGLGEETSMNIDPVAFDVKLDVALERDREDWYWMHPRCAVIPNPDDRGKPAVLMTLAKEFFGESDYFSGVYVMRTDDMGKSWTGPDLFPQLEWWKESEKVLCCVIDPAPVWHAQTGKVIVMGIRVRYNMKRKDRREFIQLQDKRPRLAAYAVYDPKSDQWTRWRMLQLPEPDTKFFRHGIGCAQWVVKPDGDLLLPVAHSRPRSPWSTTVVQCKFDGEKLEYVRHGNELRLNVPSRGLLEPSLFKFQGRYYLTLRNNIKGYVTSSDDGLNFAPVKPWTFDDGTEQGNHKTQQHWLGHTKGLFLVYNRRGANNDHVIRHRAPLFIAQVDPEKLCVVRKTERVLIPERGAPMGNFGATMITENESWVTVSEFMWPSFLAMARKKGAAGRTFVARILWAEPNR